MTGPARSAVLSAADIHAITGLLVLGDCATLVGLLPGGDLAGQIAWLTAMLRYRQVTGATR